MNKPLSPESIVSAYECRQGTFNVDSSGQASYTISLAVPPGIANMQPKLGLVYSHRQQNGVMGVGWSLSGMSSISRVKANYAVDGFNGAVAYDAKDRYALDGQRLINVTGKYGANGTVYHTEIESWRHVQAGAAMSDGFVVTMKNGDIWRYGATDDSRIMAFGGTQVRVWALSSIEDLQGNRIQYHYTATPVVGAQAEGAYYLREISYTHRDNVAANRFVQFQYEARPDALVSYIGGYPVTTSYRLKQISTMLDSSVPIRTWTFNYALGVATVLSCLSSITDTGATDAVTLPPIQMAWQDTTAPSFNIGIGSTLDQHSKAESIQMIDVNGNGKTDIVQLWRDQNDSLIATVYLATEDANGTTFVKQPNTMLGNFPATRQIFPMNLSGSAGTDLLVVYQDSFTKNLKLQAFLSNGSGFDQQPVFDTGDTWSSGHLNFFAMDANGDGRTDLVEAYTHTDNTGKWLYFRSYFSMMGDGSGKLFSQAVVSPTTDPANITKQLAFWPMDVNGNGMMDLVRVWQDSGAEGTVYAKSYLSVSSSLYSAQFIAQSKSGLGTLSLANQLAFFPADVNGDGIMDLLQIWKEPDGSGSSTLHLTAFFSDGHGGFVPGPDSSFPNQTFATDCFYPMGFNGGSQTNLLSRWGSATNELIFTLFASSPSGKFRMAAEPINAGSVGKGGTFFVGDVNGDGKADLVRIRADANNNPVATPYSSVGAYPDLVSSIVDQLGLSTTITYAPLSGPTVYDDQNATGSYPGAGALRYPNHLSPTQFPAQAVLGQALYVVSQYSQSNKAAQNRFACAQQYSFNYAAAQIDLLGRGWQGFASISRLNTLTGECKTQQFNQNYPLSGTLAALEVSANGQYSSDPLVPKAETHVLMSRATTDYQSFVRAVGATPGTSQQVLEVLQVSTQSNHYDYGKDSFDFAIKKTFEYDSYGNLTKDFYLGYVDPTTGRQLYPEQAVYRYNSYQNSVSANGWTLGYLLYAKTSANATDQDINQFLPNDYRLEQRSYTPEGYNLATQAQWDDSNNCFLTKLYSYDQFGNCTEETAPGGFVTQYDYEETYHCYRMRTTSPANAQGNRLVTLHGFDPRFGVEVAQQNENGYVNVFALDAFGRKLTHQGPLPSDSGTQGDPNAVTTLVTGTAEIANIFRSATVLTLETTAYTTDGAGGIYCEVGALQAFPVSAPGDFLRSRKYCDALGRDVLAAQLSDRAAGNALVLTVYDANNQPAKKSLPFFSDNLVAPQTEHWTKFSYDVLARPLSQRTPGGADGKTECMTSWDYGTGGAVTQTTAAGTDVAFVQRYIHHFFDDKDKVTNSIIVSDSNATTVFGYDALGRLLICVDPETASNPKGVPTSTTYDSLDRKTNVDNPDHNTTGNPTIKAATYRYDSVTGTLSMQTDAAQQAINTVYDQLGRVTAQTFTDGRNITYRYDDAQANGNARLHTVFIHNAGVLESRRTYSYDRYGNPSVEKLEVGTNTFLTQSSFDPQNRLVQKVLPDGDVLRITFQEGLPVLQTLADAQLAYPLDQYTAAGRFGRIVYGQGNASGGALAANYQFNPGDQLYGETVSNTSGVVMQLAYQYDALNQLLQITNSMAAPGCQVQRFEYTNRRLSATVLPGFADAQFKYDAAGNIMHKDGCGYTYKAHFPLQMQKAGADLYVAQPDACGRTATRTTNGATVHFTYDGLGALSRVTNQEGTALHEYLSDQNGLRILETDQNGVTTIHVDPNYQVTISGLVSSMSKFLLDSQGAAATISGVAGGIKTVRYLRRDQKSNVTHAFDSGGVLVTEMVYDGYGLAKMVSGINDVLPKYESRQWDDGIGLYYFSARLYDPMTARFLTPDSQLGASSMLQMDAWNCFAFELNCPINHTDPSGHMAAWLGGLLIGLAAVAVGVAIVVTGGAAAPLGAAFVGVLIGGGASAVGYSVTHKEDFSWKDFGIQVGISAAIGGITGGALSALSAPILASANPVFWGAVSGGLIGSTGDVLGTLANNAATGTSLTNGLAASAITGFTLGALGGAAAGKLGAMDKGNAKLVLADANRSFQSEPFKLTANVLARNEGANPFSNLTFSKLIAAQENVMHGLNGVSQLIAIPQAIIEGLDWGI